MMKRSDAPAGIDAFFCGTVTLDGQFTYRYDDEARKFSVAAHVATAVCLLSALARDRAALRFVGFSASVSRRK
jgi:hypothetical protein